MDQPALVGVAHTGLTVSDMERSLTFYRDQLGMVVVHRQLGTRDYLSTITGFEGVRLKMAFLKTSEQSEHVLELLEYESHPAEGGPRETNRPGNAHLCLRIDGIQALYERLVAQGVVFISPPVLITHGINTGALACYLRDPDGFTLELYQPPR